MKLFILSSILLFIIQSADAQDKEVSVLPEGKYETIVKSSKNKWEQGDIILLSENKYKISLGNETGEYRFSITAQRIFFTSGPLKGIYAKAIITNTSPAILIPVAENQQIGIRIVTADILGYYKN